MWRGEAYMQNSNTNEKATEKKGAYAKPRMETMTVQAIVEAMGPAQATGASGLIVEAPDRHRRRRRRR